MKIFVEKEAEKFLENKGFNVIERVYITKESELSKAIKKIKFPLVMKVSGKKIIHKNKINGIKTNIKDIKQAIKSFNQLKKIKNSEGILIQKQIKGKELLLGIKKTPEFGHTIAFGTGGIHTEELKDISFRISPFKIKEARKMIKETKISKKLNTKNLKEIEKNLVKLCQLTKKYPKIKELDINPLIIDKKNTTIVDARIVFE